MRDTSLNDMQVIQDEIKIKGGLTQEITIRKGGHRPGSGRPRGSKNKLSKEVKAKDKSIKERIIRNIDDLINAQLSLAKGLFFLYEIKMRNVAGKRKPEHILVKDPKRIKAFLDGDLEGEYHYLTAEKPENKAIDSLLDRALGKATTDNVVDSGLSINIVNYDKIEEPAHRESIPVSNDTLPVQEARLEIGGDKGGEETV